MSKIKSPPSREKIEELLKALADGTPRYAAAQKLGIGEATVGRWLRCVDGEDQKRIYSLELDLEMMPFARTDQEREGLKSCVQAGSVYEAAQVLGVGAQGLYQSMRALKIRAAKRGHAPEADMTHVTAEPFVVKGTSTYYDADGKVKSQWVKTTSSQEAQESAIRDAVKAFLEDLPKLSAPVEPDDYSTDIIPWIQIGDAHLGMLAHAMETGEDFDLKIAEGQLCTAIQMLLHDLPKTERLVINDLGDFTHYDNFAATTAASGHALDADTRFPKMVRVYSRVMRFIIDAALAKAQHVDVIINQGNHSRINDFWMRELLESCYGHTGRVHVLDNDSVFIGYRMGKTLVMVHHSDKCRPKDLIGVMTTDFKDDYGQTDYHYIDIGHVHHHFVSKEHPGAVIESWNHLAASDKWAHDAGYRSRKSISVVLRSKTYGEIGRRMLPIQQVRDQMAGQQVPAPRRKVFTV